MEAAEGGSRVIMVLGTRWVLEALREAEVAARADCAMSVGANFVCVSYHGVEFDMCADRRRLA